MKIFDKIYEFISDYEELITLILFLVGTLLVLLVIIKHYDSELTKEKNIIQQTKQYEKFEECKKIHDYWYCWNEN